MRLAMDMKRNRARKREGIPGFKRTTISVDLDIYSLGLLLAQRERRSFSNQLEVLIEAEAKRLNLEASE